MNGYISRNLPVVSAVASAAVTEGYAVKFGNNALNMVSTVSAASDVYAGVALSDIASGSTGNVCIKGGGVVVPVFTNVASFAGTGLVINTSGIFTTGSRVYLTGSNGVDITGSIRVTGYQYDAITTETATINSLVNAVLQ